MHLIDLKYGAAACKAVYAAYFVCLGVSSVLELIGVLPEPHWDSYMSAASGAFLTALEKTGFVIPLLIFIWVASGVAIMFYRTAPLGVVLPAPVMVNIFLADTQLDTEWLWQLLTRSPSRPGLAFPISLPRPLELLTSCSWLLITFVFR